MNIITSADSEFNYEECEALYNKLSEFMNNTCGFKDIVLNSHFYSFYEKERLLGCIYMNCENGDLFLNGFSVRKNHLKNMEAIKTVCSFYSCPVFAKTKNRTAEIVLKKCGFKLIKTDRNVKYLKKEN